MTCELYAVLGIYNLALTTVREFFIRQAESKPRIAGREDVTPKPWSLAETIAL